MTRIHRNVYVKEEGELKRKWMVAVNDDDAATSRHTDCSRENNGRTLSKEIDSGSESLKGRLTRLPQTVIDMPKQCKTIEDEQRFGGNVGHRAPRSNRYIGIWDHIGNCHCHRISDPNYLFSVELGIFLFAFCLFICRRFSCCLSSFVAQ